MIVIPLVGNHIQNQGRITDLPEGGCSEQGAVKTVCGFILQNLQRAAIKGIGAVNQFIQKQLDFVRIGQFCHNGFFRISQGLIK